MIDHGKARHDRTDRARSHSATPADHSDTPGSEPEQDNPEWEYRPLRLPPGITRWSAATQLTIHAEFAGWELSRVLLYSDGSRKVWLRKHRTTPGVPEPAT